MGTHHKIHTDNCSIVAEIMEGLREYQMILVDSAGKVSSADTAIKLYKLASEHAELEAELRELLKGTSRQEVPLESAFINQIRALGARLKGFGDFSKSHYILCEIIQTEDRMIRRITALIDQISDLKWKKRLVRQLDHLLDVRNNISRFQDCQPPATDRFSLTRGLSNPR